MVYIRKTWGWESLQPGGKTGLRLIWATCPTISGGEVIWMKSQGLLEHCQEAGRWIGPPQPSEQAAAGPAWGSSPKESGLAIFGFKELRGCSLALLPTHRSKATHSCWVRETARARKKGSIEIVYSTGLQPWALLSKRCGSGLRV